MKNKKNISVSCLIIIIYHLNSFIQRQRNNNILFLHLKKKK